jgi:hypothetical protein
MDDVSAKVAQHQITAWAAIPNKAAHGNYAAFDDKQVAAMVQGLRDFVSRLPA